MSITTFVSVLGLCIAVVTAINQFSTTRPRVEIRRIPLISDPDVFSIVIVNSGKAPIHLYGYKSIASKVHLTRNDASHRELLESSIKVIINPEKEAHFTASIEEGSSLFVIIKWRRMTGLHLFQFVPLFVYASSKWLRQLANSQEASNFYV